MSASNIIVGDCRQILETLPEQSVQCVVTSPPYWGQRDYGVDGMIGLEADVYTWLAVMVEVFRGVRRVLRDDGTVWLNLGDKYAGSGGAGGDYNPGGLKAGVTGGPSASTKQSGFKQKDLMGLPWRLAFALQDDGWYLRRDIIWHKPNPMPESATDRPATAHEYVFLLTKQPKYFYDADAIREPVTGNAHAQGYGLGTKISEPGLGIRHNTSMGEATRNETAADLPTDRNARTVWDVDEEYSTPTDWDTRTGEGGHGTIHKQGRSLLPGNASRSKTSEIWDEQGYQKSGERNTHPSGANLRSVWKIATQAFSGPHYATYPEKLVEPCIRAGSRPGDTILDPFSGAGTTGLVAARFDRNYIGIELNPEYAEMSRKRIADRVGVTDPDELDPGEQAQGRMF